MHAAGAGSDSGGPGAWVAHGGGGRRSRVGADHLTFECTVSFSNPFHFLFAFLFAFRFDDVNDVNDRSDGYGNAGPVNGEVPGAGGVGWPGCASGGCVGGCCPGF